MRFIGDIHGNLLMYNGIIANCDESVQVGDFGVGFLSAYGMECANEWHRDGRHKFIRGNHDDPELCKTMPGYIEDGFFDAERSIMYIGGAWSIDWAYRTPGYSWWADEELSIPELARMHELMMHYKPRIVVTHDAPESVSYRFFINGTHKKFHQTRTGGALEGMFQRHQPDVWLFGHWHESRDEVINGTRFLCLGIDEYIDLEV